MDLCERGMEASMEVRRWSGLTPTPVSGFATMPSSGAGPALALFPGLEGTSQTYHLVRPDHLRTSIEASMPRSHKSIPEIFLTRLLSTKGTVQKFVDDFFGTILKVPHNFPPPVKWLFDILDDAAVQHGMNSAEVLHA